MLNTKKSERWRNIKTNVRTNVKLQDGQILLTEKQWEQQGYLPISDDVGESLWSNQFCQRAFRYLFDDEVKKMKKAGEKP